MWIWCKSGAFWRWRVTRRRFRRSSRGYAFPGLGLCDQADIYNCIRTKRQKRRKNSRGVPNSLRCSVVNSNAGQLLVEEAEVITSEVASLDTRLWLDSRLLNLFWTRLPMSIVYLRRRRPARLPLRVAVWNLAQRRRDKLSYWMYLVEMSWLLLLVLNSQVPQHQSYLSHQCSRNKDEECIFIPVLFLLKNVFCNPSVTFKHITVAPSPPRINYMIVSPMMPITWFRRSLVPTEKSLILSLVFIFIKCFICHM